MKRPQNWYGEPQPFGRFRDPISAIIGGVSVGTKLIGGIMGHNAANDAAKIQQEAAAAAGKKVEDATNKVNPEILAAADKAGQGVISTAGAGATDVKNTADQAATGVTDAAAKGAANANDAAVQANKLLDPYATAGATAADVLNKGIAPGGDFNKTPTMADLQLDPGYAFRQQQAEQALERSAAAHGAVGGGGFLKDLNSEVQGSASQEYQAAFNRFQTSTQNRFANVSGVANSGRAAATTQGDNGINAAQFGAGLATGAAGTAGGLRTGAAQFGAGLNTGASEYAGTANINAEDLTANNTIGAAKTSADYLTQGANAAAAGKVAASNALWGGISGAADSAGQGYMMSQLMQNPAKNYFSFPGGSYNVGGRNLPLGLNGSAAPNPYTGGYTDPKGNFVVTR